MKLTMVNEEPAKERHAETLAAMSRARSWSGENTCLYSVMAVSTLLRLERSVHVGLDHSEHGITDIRLPVRLRRLRRNREAASCLEQRCKVIRGDENVRERTAL